MKNGMVDQILNGKNIRAILTEAETGPYTVRVVLEETLDKEVEVVIEDADSIEDAMEKAEQKVAADYNSGKIVLTADDINGPALIYSECDGVATDFHTF